jgi:hypothetical protein
VYVSEVTVPKLNPAPRIPQSRSLFSDSDAVTMSPDSLTMLRETKESEIAPYKPE